MNQNLLLKLVFAVVLLFPSMNLEASILDRFLNRYGTGLLLDFSAYQTINASMAQELSEQADPNDNGEYKYDISGQRYGFRLGAFLGRLIIGLEESYGVFNYDFSGPNRSSSKGKARTRVSSAFMMWRGQRWLPWFGIAFDGDGRIKGQDLELSDASGWSGGIGYKLTRWFQVNFEARTYSFGKYSSSGTMVVVPPGGNDDFRVSEVSLGVSIALEFVSKRK